MTSPARRAALAAYPPDFRSRYGEELAALAEDSGPDLRVTLDLALGAARAWLFPVRLGDPVQRARRRLQATAGTVFLAVALAFGGLAGFSRAVGDPPVPQLADAGVSGWWTVLQGLAVALALVTGAVAAPVLVAVVARGVLGRRRDVWLPAVLPFLAVGAWLGLTALMGLVASHAFSPTGPSGWGLAVAVPLMLAWVGAGFLATMACVLGGVVAYRRAELPTGVLRVVAGAALVDAALLVAIALAGLGCLVAVLRHGAVGGWVLVPALVGLALAAVAAVTATVSSSRAAPLVLG